MELIFIIIVVLAVGLGVFALLKGNRPEAMPVLATTASTRKKSPKKQESRKNVEKWDETETSPRARSESPKKKGKKKFFDPVAEGEKVVKSAMTRAEVKKRDPVKEDQDPEEERRKRQQLTSGGFVMVDEKKKTEKKTAVEEEVIEEPKSAEEEVMERLMAIRNQTFKSDKPSEQKEKTSVLNANKRSKEEIEMQIKSIREGNKNTKGKPSAAGGKVFVHNSSWSAQATSERDYSSAVGRTTKADEE